MNWIKQQVANVAGTQEPIYGPSAIKSVATQTVTAPYTKLRKDDLKWIAMDSTCVETQAFYLQADSGHLGMAQVIYSNVAGIRTTCQFNIKIFYPDGVTPNLWSSDVLDNFGFDDDKFSFYADGCAITLSNDAKSYTVKSAINEESIVNLTVTQTAPGFLVGQDGKTFFGTNPNAPWGVMRHAFWPRCRVEGSIATKTGNVNFAGRGLFVQGLQGMKPHHAAAKWNFVNFQSRRYSAVIMEFTTPPAYGSTVVNVGGIAQDGEIICAGSGNSVQHTKLNDDPENEWPEPSAVKILWTGHTTDGKLVRAEMQGNLGPRLDKIDVMAKVPGFIKAIVGGVAGTKPYIYQYSPQERIALKIEIDGVENIEEGIVFSEATFIS